MNPIPNFSLLLTKTILNVSPTDSMRKWLPKWSIEPKKFKDELLI